MISLTVVFGQIGITWGRFFARPAAVQPLPRPRRSASDLPEPEPASRRERSAAFFGKLPPETLLTAPARASKDPYLFTTPYQRGMCAIFADGSLYISRSHYQDNPTELRSLLALARQAGVQLRQAQLVGVEEIHAFYDDARRFQGEVITAESTKRAIDAIQRAIDLEANEIQILLKRQRATIRYEVSNALTASVEMTKTEAERLFRTIYSMADVTHGPYLASAFQDGVIEERLEQFGFAQQLQSIRMHFNPSYQGRHLNMRLHPRKPAKPLADIKTNVANAREAIEKLGFPPRHCAILGKWRLKSGGVFLFSAPTGMGKTHTIAAQLDAQYWEQDGAIQKMAIMDPPEMELPDTIQIPVLNSVGSDGRGGMAATTAHAMRSAFHLMFVGELRDSTSIQTAYLTGAAGRVVYSTTHTFNAPMTPKRLIGLGGDPTMILDHRLTRGISSQRLIPKLCPDCKQSLGDVRWRSRSEDRDRHQYWAEMLQTLYGDERALGTVFLEGRGRKQDGSTCETCQDAPRPGLLGRALVAEFLTPTEEFMRIYAESAIEAEHWWIKQGGETMRDHALELMFAGILSPREVTLTLDWDIEAECLNRRSSLRPRGSLVKPRRRRIRVQSAMLTIHGRVPRVKRAT